MRAGWRNAVAAAFAACLLAAAEPHPVLAIGSPAPDFALPGVDGKIHRLSDYAASPVLVVVFTCNHCPIAQMYETRIQKLSDDYRGKGAAVVAIQGNDPQALRVDELDCSDIGDTLAEMKIRVAYKHLQYPYLYAGDTQGVTRAYGPQATPHVFVFDRERRLRYEGRVDDNYRLELVKIKDARNAIDALLASQPVAVAHTGVFGCSTKWKEKEADRIEALRQIESEPVTLNSVSAEDLRRLVTNATGKVTLIRFWAAPATGADDFADLEATFRMYRDRDFELVTVAMNKPEERTGVLKILEAQHATSRNLLFEPNDPTILAKLFDPDRDSGAPYTLLIGADGKPLYRGHGAVDWLQLRRRILASVPADYAGFSRYWITEQTK